MRMKGLDVIDNEILSMLLNDGRISYSDVAIKVGLTRTAVKNRISAMEEKGIIKGYKAVVNPMKAPKMMTFALWIQIAPAAFEKAKKYFKSCEETLTLLQTAGECQLLAVCVVSDSDAMRDFMNTAFEQVEGIQNINTYAVLDLIKGAIIPEKETLGEILYE